MNPQESDKSLTFTATRTPPAGDAADTQLLIRYCNQWERAKEAGAGVAPADLCRDRPDLLPDLLRAIEILGMLTTTRSSPPPHPRSHVPRIPGYEILAEIGRGGMGVVYKVRQLPLDRTVALKLVSNPDSHPTQLLRFQLEAESIARLQHPNVVQIFEAGVADDRPFLAIEYVDGVTLKQRTAGVPQPPFEAARLLETVARAVQHAHDRGIVHRDLKPQNILLTAAGVPKVTDFGLARAADGGHGLTLSSDFLGTPAYAAPEQVLSQADRVGPRTDVYALGVTLYELLAGHVPFQAESLQQLLRQVAEADPTPVRRLVPGCPCDLQTICMKCLEKDPDKRYATAAALAEDLRRFQADEPIQARPAKAVERAVRWGRRNPAVAALLLAVGSLLLAGAVGGGTLSIHLAAALRAAEGDRDRAADSERKTRAYLAESRAAAATLALQRGNGRVALQQLAAAADAGLDTPALRFLRVKALCAVHDVRAAIDEATALAARDDLGDRAGEILLWKADLELDAQGVELDRGLQQIRLALARGLPAADGHYARGLLAKTVPEAAGHFRRAVDADPTNPRTNAALAMLLVLSGEHPEARERLAAARLLFPDNPVFGVIQATLESLQERPEAARRHLAQLRRQLGDAPYKVAEGLVGFCQDATAFVRQLERMQCGDPGASQLSAMWTLQRALQKFQPTATRGAADLYLPFPPGLLAEARTVARDVPSAFTILLPGNAKPAAAAFERLAGLNPDGFFLLFAATLRAKAGGRDDWRAAGDLLARATACTSMFPVRRMTLYAAAVAASNLHQDAPPAEAADHRARALGLIARLAEVEMLPEQASKLLAHCDRLDAPPELGWRVLAAWERADEADPRLPLARANRYLRSHDYEAAIQLADEHLKRAAAPEWRALRTQATADRRRRAEAVVGSARP